MTTMLKVTNNERVKLFPTFDFVIFRFRVEINKKLYSAAVNSGISGVDFNKLALLTMKNYS